MNRKAAELGMENTRYVTPSGLDAEGQGSTAHDLAVLACAALQNPEFRAVCGQTNGHMTVGGVEYWMSNHNRLLKEYEGCIGLKTGYTDEAGRCLVSAAERDGAVIVSVVLHDPEDWDDSAALLDWGFRPWSPVGAGNRPVGNPSPRPVGNGNSPFLYRPAPGIPFRRPRPRRTAFPCPLGAGVAAGDRPDRRYRRDAPVGGCRGENPLLDGAGTGCAHFSGRSRASRSIDHSLRSLPSLRSRKSSSRSPAFRAAS